MAESTIVDFLVTKDTTVIDLLEDGRQVFSTLPVMARRGDRVKLVIERCSKLASLAFAPAPPPSTPTTLPPRSATPPSATN